MFTICRKIMSVEDKAEKVIKHCVKLGYPVKALPDEKYINK